MISKWKKKLPLLCDVMSVITIAAIAVLILPFFLAPVFGFQIFTAIRDCPEADIKTGSLVIAQKVDPAVIKTDQVIAYRDGEGIEIGKVVNNWQFEGEYEIANSAIEKDELPEPVYDQLVGTVIGHFAYLGKYGEFIRTPLGIFYVILMAACAAMFRILAKRLRELQGLEEQKE